MAVKVDTCCGCVELRTGCFILAYLGLIGNLLLLPLLIFGFETILHKAYTESRLDPQTVTAIFFILLATLLVSLIFSIIFVIGLHQNKRHLIKCYLVFSLTTTVICGFMYILRIIYGGTIQMVFQLLLNLAVQVYYIIVIRSYYFQLKEEEYRGRPATIDKV